MVAFKEIISGGCCGKTNFNLDLERPIKRDNLSLFTSNGFVESPKFIKAGIFYVEDSGIIASGTFGAKRINIQTKSKDKWQSSYTKFKKIITDMS